MQYKIPISVLVVIHTPELQVLLLERADRPGFWQSVTGSQDAGETLPQTAQREVFEETGLDTGRYGLADWRKQSRYEIYRRWRSRYAQHRARVQPGAAAGAAGDARRQGAPAIRVAAVARRGGQSVFLEQCRCHMRAAAQTGSGG